MQHIVDIDVLRQFMRYAKRKRVAVSKIINIGGMFLVTFSLAGEPGTRTRGTKPDLE